jgi:hypothetical protein
MPVLAVGTHVAMGQMVGVTGNSGAGSERRRPAIHFAAWFSDSPDFLVGRMAVIPARGQWMDPNAIYRGHPPFDSQSMKALPSADKRVPIPVMLGDGSTIPAGTKLIWPYVCRRN